MSFNTKNLKLHLIGVGLFVLSITLVLLLEYHFNLMKHAYWVYHFLFGVGFTGLVYGCFLSIKIASFATLFWSFANEMIQDHFDRLEVDPTTEYFVQWDHLGADITGWFVTLLIVLMIAKKQFHRHTCKQVL